MPNPTHAQRTLYVTDMDGTLLDLYSRVSPDSASLIADLSRRGALITVATARTVATVVPLMRDCHTTVPYVTMTGAALWDPRADRFDHVAIMPDAVALAVDATLRAAGLSPFVYTLAPDRRTFNVYHAGELTRAERTFVEPRSRLALKRFILDPDPQAYPPSRPDTVLYFTMGPVDITSAVADRLRAIPGCSVSSYADSLNPALGLVEVFAAGIDKGTTVRQLASRLGANRIVAFGDNLNDLSLLAVADLAVAVDNALPQVKAAADIVIGPNSTDAVARFIADDFDSRH